MSDSLHVENFSLRQRLESLLQEARRNEEKMRRFDKLERCLIGARSFDELLHVLLADYRAAFGIESVSLALVDTDYEISRLLAESADGNTPDGLLLRDSAESLRELYAHGRATWLGPFDAYRHGDLFAAGNADIASVALLPLLRGDELIGSLNLGSSLPERYEGGVATDFLDRLAAIAAVCLEGALAQERLKRVGLTDALTGVQNRRYFEHRCRVEVAQSLRHKQPLACMFLDVDKFKRVNDNYGHQTGDEVLRGVAAVIQAQLRAGDTVARYGGEEFVVLLPQTASCHAREIAERIRMAVAARGFALPSGGALPVTISIGLSMLALEDSANDIAIPVEHMVAAADRALYEAKNSGRNRVVGDRAAALPAMEACGGGMLAQLLDLPAALWRRLMQLGFRRRVAGA